jgi:hypothetical protein
MHRRVREMRGRLGDVFAAVVASVAAACSTRGSGTTGTQSGYGDAGVAIVPGADGGVGADAGLDAGPGTVLWDASAFADAAPCTPAGFDDAGPVPLDDQQTCGARLAPRWALTSEGVRTFVGWYDRLPGAPCSPGLAADKTLRCLPVASEEVAYADEFCTQPLAPAYAEATALSSVSHTECGPLPAHVFEIAGTKMFPSVYGYDFENDCTPSSQGGEYFVPGAEILPTSFVALSPASVSATSGVTTQWLQGEDGARGFVGVANGATKEACQTAFATDGSLGCHPSLLPIFSGWFADADCKFPVAPLGSCASTASGPVSPYQFSVAAGCPARLTDYATGVATGNVYDEQDGTCTYVGLQAGYLTGAQVPPSTFPAATALPRAGGRLQPNLASYVGAGTLRYHGWYDTTSAADCNFAFAADGVLRCVPEAAYTEGAVGGGRLFADAGCSVPLGELKTSPYSPSAPDCSASGFAVWIESVADHLEPVTHVFPVTTAYTGPPYTGTPQSCDLASFDRGPFATLGAEIAPASFVAAVVSSW